MKARQQASENSKPGMHTWKEAEKHNTFDSVLTGQNKDEIKRTTKAAALGFRRREQSTVLDMPALPPLLNTAVPLAVSTFDVLNAMKRKPTPAMHTHAKQCKRDVCE